MATGWQKQHAGGAVSATERQIAQLARRQHQVVAHSQLLAVGLSPRQIGIRRDRGHLQRIAKGIYSLTAPPFTIHQRWMAALLAGGEGAALCGSTSAALQDIGQIPSRCIHVRSPSRSGRGRSGVCVHQGSIDPRDIRVVDDIRCTSADLVLIELAPDLGEAELEVILVAAESKGYLKRGRLGELVAESRGRPGIPKLERLLELEPVFAKSGIEIEILPIARLAGLDRPRINFPIPVPGLERPLIVDAAWPDLRMVIEADGQRFHGDWERAKVDRERDQLLALAGWRCHRFPRDRFGEWEWMAERVGELARIGAGRSRPA